MNANILNFIEKQSESSGFWQGALLYQNCMAAGKQERPQADVLYRYGYELLGMAYSVYIHQVIERVRRYGIDHVVFVAREGYLFEKVYEILAAHLPQPNGINKTTSYAYLSRRSTFLASFSRLTTREVVLSSNKPWPLTLKNLLSFVGLPPADFEPFAKAHGIDMQQPIAQFWNDKKLLAFLSDMSVQSRVYQYHQRAYNDLKDYLSQCHFWGRHRKVALVDIGWDGTIQDNLVRAFGHLPEFPLIHGLYFGRRESKTFLKYSSSFANGLMFDYRDRNINGESISGCIELFEKGCSAPHASTVGYRRHETGEVWPIFEDESSPSRQAEIASNAAVAVMQQGALDFVHQYGQQIKLRPVSATAIKPFVQALITRYIAFPTYKEAYQVAYHLGHQLEDTTDNTARRFAIVPWDIRVSLKEGGIQAVKKMLKRTFWTAASLRLTKIPGLCCLYTIKRYLLF